METFALRLTPSLPAVKFNPAGVPAALRALPRWVLWRYEPRKKKTTKVPIIAATGRHASTTVASDWTTFEAACDALPKTPGCAGLGFVFTQEDGFVGIDLDACVDSDGDMSSSADGIVRSFGTYAEFSPSGTGVKLILRGKKPTADCRSKKVEGMKEIEIYEWGRFFTITGAPVPGSAADVTDAQDALDDLCEELWPPKPARRDATVVASGPEGFEGSDPELLDAARGAKNGNKFSALYERGDTSGYGGDDSAADCGLCTMLAFWTAKDRGRIESLFRGSKLYREKWERQDYRDRTIAAAIEACGEVYRGRAKAAAREIWIGPNEHRCINEAAVAIVGDGDLYARGNTLARVLRVRSGRKGPARPQIVRVETPTLREILTRNVRFMKRTADGENKECHPPSWLVSGLEARGQWQGVRELTGVATAPFLRPDGTVCAAEGYDDATGVLLVPNAKFPEIVAADVEGARASCRDLLEVVSDFNFEAPEHSSAWLAAVLTPVARFGFEGPAPLFLFDANVRGAGKGLLAKVGTWIALGDELSADAYSHETEEMRKRITSIAMAGYSIVLLDNLAGPFGNASLDRALTTTRWQDRALSTNNQVDLPLLATWFATGNNVQVEADTARRVVPIRLDVLHERPEDRSDFRHKNLLAYVAEHRPRLLAAALTILAAYRRAGCPDLGLKPFGSFEGWSGLVRSALVWAGQPDPCAGREQFLSVADTGEEVLSQLIAAWREWDSSEEGIVIADMISALYEDSPPRRDDDKAKGMRAALEALVGCRAGGTPTARRVGSKLKHLRRRVLGDSCLDANPAEKRRSGQVWRLLKVGGGPATVRLCDSDSGPSGAYIPI